MFDLIIYEIVVVDDDLVGSVCVVVDVCCVCVIDVLVICYMIVFDM